MAPFDFYLFPQVKSHFRGTLYESNEGVIEAVNEYLGYQVNGFYFVWIRKLEQRWAIYTHLKDDYIEKIVKFSFPGNLKYKGLRTFVQPSYGSFLLVNSFYTHQSIANKFTAVNRPILSINYIDVTFRCVIQHVWFINAIFSVLKIWF